MKRALEQLHVYQDSMDFVVQVYSFAECEFISRDFNLKDQILRASVSIPSNLAEGYLMSKKRFLYHLNVSIGSANEVMTLLEIAARVYTIETRTLVDELDVLIRKMASLKKILMLDI